MTRPLTAMLALLAAILWLSSTALLADGADPQDGAASTGTAPSGTAHRRLPDGLVAARRGMRAWYVAPTERYPHGILGDAIEADDLTVEHDGATVTLLLDEASVFEDIQPRLQDLTGDDTPEIVTIESHRDRGARVAVYRLSGDALTLYTASAHIGRANRWLNIAGVLDFDRDGVVDIAWVETPDIGGILKIATVRPGRLNPVATFAADIPTPSTVHAICCGGAVGVALNG